MPCAGVPAARFGVPVARFVVPVALWGSSGTLWGSSPHGWFVFRFPGVACGRVGGAFLGVLLSVPLELCLPGGYPCGGPGLWNYRRKRAIFPFGGVLLFSKLLVFGVVDMFDIVP